MSVVFERLLHQQRFGWRTTEQKSVENKLIKAVIPKIVQYKQGLCRGNESLFPYCIDLSEFYTAIINVLYYNILLYLREKLVTKLQILRVFVKYNLKISIVFSSECKLMNGFKS
jgi:hypothetical protein